MSYLPGLRLCSFASCRLVALAATVAALAAVRLMMLARPVMFLVPVPFAMFMTPAALMPILIMMLMAFRPMLSAWTMAVPVAAAAVTMPLLAIVCAVAASGGFVRFQRLGQLFQQAGQAGALVRVQGGKDLLGLLAPFAFMLAKGLVAFLCGSNYEVAPILLVTFAADQAMPFQLAQNFAQGSGAHVEHFHEVALVQAAPLPQDGENVPLGVAAVPRSVPVPMVMQAGHVFDHASEEPEQLFATAVLSDGIGLFRHV